MHNAHIASCKEKYMKTDNLLDKIRFVLNAAKNKTDDDTTLSVIMSLTAEHSEERNLGKFMGYSVSDYAIASLKWMDTEKSNQLFKEEYNKLSDDRKTVIGWLIPNNYHLEM